MKTLSKTSAILLATMAILLHSPRFATKASAVEPQKMNVVLLGDSNLSTGGDDCTGERSWSKWFKELFQPKTCVSYARSGATWTNNALTKHDTKENIARVGNSNVIYNQVNRFDEAYKNGTQPEPSLIIVACGTNDAWFQSQRPQMYAETTDKIFKLPLQDLLMKKVNQVTTLAESVRYNCEILRYHFPDARILLLTPLQSVQGTEAKIQKVGDVIEDCGKHMGIDVIRLDKICPIKAADERIKKHYTIDGTHTSVEGAKMVGEKIAELLKN